MGIVEAARERRYDFLNDAADKLRLSLNINDVRIATAHNADDLTETLLFNLMRGAGTSGLSSIPPVRDSIIRPMLHISRDEIMEYINVRGLRYVEDSSNKLTNQTRNKIRHLIMPVIKEINPKFIDASVKTSELLRHDDEYLQIKAVEYLQSCENFEQSGLLYLNSFNTLPYSIASRVLKLINKKLSYQHINDIIDLCNNSKPKASLSLPGMKVKKDKDRLFFL